MSPSPCRDRHVVIIHNVLANVLRLDCKATSKSRAQIAFGALRESSLPWSSSAATIAAPTQSVARRLLAVRLSDVQPQFVC
jgi:hypothetical protein